MKLILLGAPGCGKGTLANDIVKNYNFTHISTGQLLRQHVADKTPIGILAKQAIENGQFVSDEIVLQILKEKLEEINYDNFILDGFPRNISQAEELQKLTKIDKVVLLDVDYQVIIERISGRRTCSDCGRIFNTSFYKSVECDVCKGILVQRSDDTQDVIQERLKVYDKQTKPLIEFYKKHDNLYCLKAGKTAQETFEKFVKEVLEAK